MLTRSMVAEWVKYNILSNGIGSVILQQFKQAPIREDGHSFNDFIISRSPAGC